MHRYWVVPLTSMFVAPALGYLALTLTLTTIPTSDATLATAAIMVLAWGLMWIAPIVFAILTLTGVAKMRRRSREQKAASLRQQQVDRAWANARIFYQEIASRRLPTPLEYAHLIPRHGETFFVSGDAWYGRYYGTNENYVQSSTLAFGNPIFVAAALTIDAVSNRSRRDAAIQQAEAQWREHRYVAFAASNQRIICNINRVWLSFEYEAIAAIYPEPESWALVLEFHTAEPLMLRGDNVPMAAVLAMLATAGEEALARHPNFESLRAPAHAPATEAHLASTQ